MQALNSFTLEVPIKKQFHRFIIGPKGAYVNKIKDATGVRLIFPAAQDEEADTVTIIGKEASCGEARDKILARVKELESIVEETVDVPAAYHRNFFQRQGAVCRLQCLLMLFSLLGSPAPEGDHGRIRRHCQLPSHWRHHHRSWRS